MFFLDIAVVIGLRSQLFAFKISVPRCHRDIALTYNFATAFDVYMGCSCAFLQLHSCRMQIFLESIGQKRTGQFLKLHFDDLHGFLENQVRKQSENDIDFFPSHHLLFFAVFGFRFAKFLLNMRNPFF